jgi:hypothetical protein
MSKDKGREESPEGEDEPVASNSFANDGSFLEQFRKSMQKEEEQKAKDEGAVDESDQTPEKNEEKKREAERFIAGYMGQMKVMRVNTSGDCQFLRLNRVC